MVQRLVIWLLMVALVGSVRAEDAKEVVIASAEELKGIKAKKITWKKDGAKNESSYVLMADDRCPDGVWATAALETLRIGSTEFLKAIESKDVEAAKSDFSQIEKILCSVP